MKIIVYQICKQNGKSKQCNFKNGLYTVWTMQRIQEAFNFGKGTLKDFKNYVENNKSLSYFEFMI